MSISPRLVIENQQSNRPLMEALHQNISKFTFEESIDEETEIEEEE